MRPAAMLLEVDADAVRRARKCLRDVAIRLSELDQKIVVACAVGAGCVRREGLAAIGHRGKRLVVDCNQGRGVFGDVTRLRDYHRNGLADEGHFLLGKYEWRDIGWELRGAKLQRQALLREMRRKIRERQYRVHAGAVTRSARIDAADRGVGVRAADKCSLQHVW